MRPSRALLPLLLVGCSLSGPASVGGQSPGMAVAARSAGSMSSAEGFELANREALSWDAGARLARIEGEGLALGYMIGDWTYTWVSPRKPREVLQVVRSDRDVMVRPPTFMKGLEALSETMLLDSRQVVAVAERNGLVSRKVHRFVLDQANEQHRPVWTLETPEGQFRIDARTGLVLAHP